MSSAINARILVLDSDAASARLLSELLLGNGMHVDVTRECSHTLERAKQEFPDLIILNTETMSHGSSDIVRDLRNVTRQPILVLTTEGDLETEIRVLESGADGCLPITVNPELLLATANSLLRRSRGIERTEAALRVGSMTLDVIRRSAIVHERPLELTTSEFDLLWLLVSHAGETLTRDQISHILRGYEWNGAERSIDLGISRLRRKLGDDGRNPCRIKSVRGTGYMWVPE